MLFHYFSWQTENVKDPPHFLYFCAPTKFAIAPIQIKKSIFFILHSEKLAFLITLSTRCITLSRKNSLVTHLLQRGGAKTRDAVWACWGGGRPPQGPASPPPRISLPHPSPTPLFGFFHLKNYLYLQYTFYICKYKQFDKKIMITKNTVN